MRSQSKGLQHAPMNARKCFQHGIASFSFHFLLVGVTLCCLRVGADKPTYMTGSQLCDSAGICSAVS